jgi:formiminotetrahydrofolate cyclodeaminase
MAEGGLAALSVAEFLRRLASGDPTPGGGAASALTAALGASLVSMVCNLTLGRARYAEYEADARMMQAQADSLRERIEQYIDRDAAAYGEVIAAYKLPRATDQEKAARSEAIQDATLTAALVPLSVVEASGSVIELAEQALGRTNPNAASDLAVAALLAAAAMDGAAANVEVNLSSLRDGEERARIAQRLANARAGRREQAARIVERTHG